MNSNNKKEMDKDHDIEQFKEQDLLLKDFYRRNGNGMPDVDKEFEKFRRKHMRPKVVRLAGFVAVSAAAVALLIFFFIGKDSGQMLNANALVAFTASEDCRFDAVVQQEDQQEMVVNSNIVSYKDLMPKKSDKNPMYTLTTHSGKTICAILEDSTEVWLNANSRIVFPANFACDQRCVELEGEAYFAVAKDTKRPFYVKAGGTTTKVLGTEFNVNTYNRDKIMVTLVEGSLEVRRTGNDCKMLSPGELASIGSKGINVDAVDTYPYTAWKRGVFYFDEAPLLDVVREIGKWYNVSVIFNNRDMVNRKVFFSADRNSRLEEIVEAISLIGNIKVEIMHGQLIIE